MTVVEGRNNREQVATARSPECKGHLYVHVPDGRKLEPVLTGGKEDRLPDADRTVLCVRIELTRATFTDASS
ncbi:hypothetical protein LZ189_13860, partial [Rhodovulum sulfidophilum]|nr:hypothetical protein [Rhodovulum sulfidophilum]